MKIIEKDLKRKEFEKIGMQAQDTWAIFSWCGTTYRKYSRQSGQGFGQLMDELPQERLSIAVTAMQTESV